MSPVPKEALSRRERQIMNVLYRLGEAGADEVHRELGADTSFDSVRVMLRLLEKKGRLVHRSQGRRHIYRSAVPVERARLSALKQVLGTFFQGSTPQAVSALLDLAEDDLSVGQLKQLEGLIQAARERKEKP